MLFPVRIETASFKFSKMGIYHVREMVWKAKSHAAYQGYSHLSGIGVILSLTMWNQLRLRTSR